MTLTPISLGTQSNRARYGHQGTARLINCYTEKVGEEGKSPVSVHAVDGFDAFATPAVAGAVRSMLSLSDSDLYAVIGRLMYRVDSSGSATSLGGIPSDGFCSMARNRSATPQIAIVCDGLYFKVEGGALTQIFDPDLPPPTSVCNLNGYFVFQLKDGRMFSSELDSENVLATDFTTASSKPDGGVIAWVRGQELLSGGTESIEAWADQGGETFALSRVTNVKRSEDQKDIGVKSAASVAESYFVGSDNTVRVISGYQAQRVSSHYLERLIEAETDPSTIRGFSWGSAGHTFYAVTGSTWTYVYDSTTSLWHERKSYGRDNWRISHATQFGNAVIFGDDANGKLYRNNATTNTEAGEFLVCEVWMPPVHAEPYRLRHNALYVDVVPGVGIASGATENADPQLMMDYSDDGGATFSTQRTASLGTEGNRLRRVRFNRLGVARTRTYRLSISASVARSIGQISLDMHKLAA